MPYAPTERFDPSPFLTGASDAGKSLAEGIAKMDANKQKMEGLELSARLIAAQHPELVDAATLEKFSKGGLGQRQALVGEMTAAIANKYRERQLGQTDTAQQITLTGMGLENDRAAERNALTARELQQREAEHVDSVAGSIPRFLKGPNGTTYIAVPKSGYVQPVAKPPIPAPGGKDRDVIRGPDGTPAYELRWNPSKGVYDKFDLRPRAADPFAALGGGGGQQPGAAAAPAKGQQGQKGLKFEPGKVYVDAAGNKARYKADGSWEPVR